MFLSLINSTSNPSPSKTSMIFSSTILLFLKIYATSLDARTGRAKILSVNVNNNIDMKIFFL